MQQYLYYHATPQERAARIRADFPPHDYLLIHLVGNADSLKISDIRLLQSSLAVTANRPRLVWLEEAHTLTLPAQHALLKTLEEPPMHTSIILSTSSPALLLPTIISRLKLVQVAAAPVAKLSAQELVLIKQALSSSPGTRLELAHTLGKKRPEAEGYFATVIQTLHQIMQETSSPKSLLLLSKISKSAHLALDRLSANTNVTLTLESFFLAL